MMVVREAFPEYKKPSVAIDTVLIRTKEVGVINGITVDSKQLQVLLVRRKGTDLWHLPGTILRLGETPSEAIGRILDNKVNIEDTEFEQLYTIADNPNRDERGHVISIVYIGLYKNMEKAIGNLKNNYESQWFWVGPYKNEERILMNETTGKVIKELDFDHEQVIHDTITRLQGKLMYTDVGFKLIQDRFTIRSLENTFVAVMEKDIPGFRRYIGPKIVDTNEKESDAGHRPAHIFMKK